MPSGLNGKRVGRRKSSHQGSLDVEKGQWERKEHLLLLSFSDNRWVCTWQRVEAKGDLCQS